MTTATEETTTPDMTIDNDHLRKLMVSVGAHLREDLGEHRDIYIVETFVQSLAFAAAKLCATSEEDAFKGLCNNLTNAFNRCAQIYRDQLSDSDSGESGDKSSGSPE